MVRPFVLLVALCLLVVAGCSAPPPGPAASFVAPHHAAAPDTPAAGTWAPVDLASSAPARQEHDHDGGDDLDDAFDDMSSQHFTVMLGERQLDDDEWDPVEDQFSAGLGFDATDPDSGHGFEVGATYSSEDDSEGPVDIDANVFDIYGGYRYTFDVDGDGHHGEADADDISIHPYVAGGGAIVRGEAEIDTPGGDDSDDDISPAVYLRAGIGFDLTEKMRLGVDYRHLFLSDMDIGSIDDADFDQFMLTLGFVF